MTHRSHITGRGTSASLTERRGWSLLISAWLHTIIVVGVVRCPAGAPPLTKRGERLVSIELTQELARALSGAVGSAPADAPRPGEDRVDAASAVPLPSEAATAPAVIPAAAAHRPDEVAATPAEPEPVRPESDKLDPEEPVPQEEEVIDEVAPDPAAEAPKAVEAEEKPEVEEPDLTDAQQYVRLNERDEAEPLPVDVATNTIAGRDSRAPQTSRTLITAAQDGPQRPEILGSEAAKATPAKNVDPSDPAEKHGGQVLAQEARPAKTGGGGGLQGEGVADGAKGHAGDTTAGGEAAPAGAAGRVGRTAVLPPAPAASQPGSGAVTAQGVPIAPIEAPDWWQPMASFVGGAPTPEAPPTPVTAAAEPVVAVVPAPATRQVVAKAERPDKLVQTGGNDRIGEAAPRPGEVESDVEGPEVGPRVGAVDPVEDLRNALGWGGIDREKLKPRQSTVGYVGSEASVATSPQTVLDREIELSNVVWVPAHETPLGKYFDVVYPLLQDRWEQQDLDILERGLGIQGEVSVVFRIRANGRVEQVALHRSSGNSALDQMALASVPEKLPRIPREVGAESVLHKVAFRYDNPLVTAAGAR